MISYTQNHKIIKRWIFLSAVLVFIMVAVGGLTRLTESGLSIVEWKLVSGILPPITEELWQQEFAEYKTSPQYQQVNRGMSLQEFKNIYWLEYIHRLLGRLIGLVFIIPWIYFAFTKTMSKPVAISMFGIMSLVGFQGFLGWYMVASGLVNVPWVSPYRLAAHLGVAAIIFAALIYMWHRIGVEPATRSNKKPRFAILVLSAIFIQLLLGALVAGLDAGLVYNSFPYMDGNLVPDGLFIMKPLFVNFFENVTMVQFQHRVGAFIVTALILLQHIMIMKNKSGNKTMKTSVLLVVCCFVQMSLGIYTLLHAVPIIPAVLHQVTAFIMIGLCVRLCHLLYYENNSSSNLSPIISGKKTCTS